MALGFENNITLKNEDLIEVLSCEKNGKPMEDGRQLYKVHIRFYKDGQPKFHDLYEFKEVRPGEFYLPALNPRELYVQQIKADTKERYITRKPVVLLKLGAFVHA